MKSTYTVYFYLFTSKSLIFFYGGKKGITFYRRYVDLVVVRVVERTEVEILRVSRVM